MAHDIDKAEGTISKVIEANVQDKVLVIIAHDNSLLPVMDFFPNYTNRFKEKGRVKAGRWLYLKVFAKSIKY